MKLVTKRLILREITMKDAESITENVNNLKVSKNLSIVPYPYKLKDGRCFVNYCKKEIKKKPRTNYGLGIELKTEKKVIGMIGLTHMDIFQGTAIVGYWLGEKYWRQGIMSEAFQKILEFAFNKLKLRRVNISASKDNKASNAIIKKFGFKKEGMRRKALRAKSTGKIHDENIYGLLKTEFKK